MCFFFWIFCNSSADRLSCVQVDQVFVVFLRACPTHIHTPGPVVVSAFSDWAGVAAQLGRIRDIHLMNAEDAEIECWLRNGELVQVDMLCCLIEEESNDSRKLTKWMHMF